MGFSLQIPSVGQPHSTEDVKVGNDLSTLQTWGNGNIADSDLAAPVSAVRKLLLQASSMGVGGQATGTYTLYPSGGLILSGATSTAGVWPALWSADSGLSSQPQDFQLAGRSSFARIRVVVAVNSFAPGCTFTIGLYPITSTATGAGVVGLNLGTVVSGSTVAVTTPSASSLAAFETGQFALPTVAAQHVLGVVVSGASIAGSSGVGITAQLYGYNA